MNLRRVPSLLVVAAGLLLPGAAWAQSIAGVVRDVSGGVLPGVTVEATSPALIEKTRTVATDGEGRYNIVELRPGIYTVTFTIGGFTTFRREGIELTTGFTAVVNPEMRVGALEETVTVTGASPVVDTQNVRTQTVLARAVLDALPAAQTTSGFASLTVGATTAGVGGSMQDVGGNRGEQYGAMMIHGSRTQDTKYYFDGMRYNNLLQEGGGGAKWWIPNQAAVTEVVLETSGIGAEATTGGVQQNTVPKDGGNVFKVYFNTSGTNNSLQQKNLTDRLRARGLTAVSEVKQVYDAGIGAGGPIRQNKLWFYTGHRWWGAQEYYAGIFYNKTHGTPIYTPDPSRQAYFDVYQRDHSLRLTWQAAPKHKLTLSYSNQKNCQCLQIGGAGTPYGAPDAYYNHHFVPSGLAIGTWSYPASNRLLLEAGVARLVNFINTRMTPGTTRADISITELSQNFVYNSNSAGLSTVSYQGPEGTDVGQHNERFSVSYITGSHAFRVGVQTLFGRSKTPYTEVNQDVHYRFNRGAPAQLVQWASPGAHFQRMKDLGVYAQDQWTVSNLTLNLGLRFDWVNAWVPEQDRPGGRFVPAFHIDRIDDVPNLTDLNPRVGVAYDLFRDGKTALKFSLGRYVSSMGTNIAFAVNPANAIALSAVRTWADANGDFKPDCVLENFAANGECGALDNRRFGTTQTATNYAKDVLEGFGHRLYNWQTSVSVQQELRQGVALNVGYFHTTFGNFIATDNALVEPGDYDPFCITAPVDARLPGGGGYRICDGLGDINPRRFAQVSNVVTKSSHFGKQREVYDGVDVIFNARFGGGKLLQGGMNVGRTATECVVVDAPVQFCKNTPEFFRPGFKFSGIYPLPVWGLQASATFQNLPGIPVAATYVATNAEIKPSLGRDLAAGPRGVAVVTLIKPNTVFEDRLTQLDARLTKIFQLGRFRVQGMFDAYNLFNSDAILGENARYGSLWLQPIQIVGARLFKFGAQIDF